jgi:hypothetical protein
VTYSHDGDLGDTLAAMAIMRELGGGDLVLYPTNTRERYSPRRVGVIAPLLECQHYIRSVRYADRAADDGIDLGAWRFNYRSGLNLVDMYFSWIRKPHLDRDQPWLWCHEPLHAADVVFCRSARYHGDFPWRRAVTKYRGRSVFVGLPEEHQAFVAEFGDVPYRATADLWEVARVVQAAKLVLVNQTCNFWVAEALKRPLCLEAANGNIGLRNCHWDRTGSIYGTSQLMELPDLDILDERLAYVCAERDLDRSVLGDKRLPLARAALSVAHLPGDAAELGVYRGGASAIIAAALPGKTVHLFDTFEGLPEDDEEGAGHRKGDFACGVEEVRRFLAGYNVLFHPGRFPSTTGPLGEGNRFCFVHLDADTFQSTADGIRYFWPRLTPGGILMFDDYGWPHCPGVKRAIDELLPGVTLSLGANHAWAMKNG